MKRFVVGIILVVSAAALAGCATMKGAGEDLEKSGQNIQKAASK